MIVRKFCKSFIEEHCAKLKLCNIWVWISKHVRCLELTMLNEGLVECNVRKSAEISNSYSFLVSIIIFDRFSKEAYFVRGPCNQSQTDEP